ncbi:hypothetical protein PR202_ga04181 [Eleusine coracana subsp. coracana]|uniref:Uncharacterized protein n=1 Tax=Eleusine coracana subsp. coracana TaxID=191504 RepID=A0AAV5BRN2_ELECO|nr:hypothetical protein PR202_ga04181 [Eleusine coracana subsp. coracana]
MGGPPARAPGHGVPPPSYTCGPRPLPCGMPPVGLRRTAGVSPAPSIANAMACATRRQCHQLSTRRDLPLTSRDLLSQLLWRVDSLCHARTTPAS